MNPWSFTENFFEGVTTAHGINQCWKPSNGVIRRIFWAACFGLAFWGLFFFIIDAVTQYIGAFFSTTTTTDTHDNLLPMITMCNLSPIRCGCTAFYDDAILADDTLVQKVLPFLCSSVLVFQGTQWNPQDSYILENTYQYVDLGKTKQMMKAFKTTSGVLDCDVTGTDYTAVNIVARLKSKNISYAELYQYAGWSNRDRMIRGCMAIDTDSTSATVGSKVSCMGGAWWGPTFLDTEYGACQTFNPCHGFPVGGACITDNDCKHTSDKSLDGGKCDTVNNICYCTRCADGKGCKLAQQPNAGLGNGIRIMANVNPIQDPPLGSSQKARWSNGLLVHLHSEHDYTNLGAGFSVSPGQISSVAVGYNSYVGQDWPFSNCSASMSVAQGVCVTRCLRRMQAIECCGMSVPQIVKGWMPVTHGSSPTGAVTNLTDPSLACNMLDPAVASCFADQAQKVSDGLACFDGSMGFTSPYYSFWLRRNWYDNRDDGTETTAGSQEQSSSRMAKHCVFSERPEAETKYGVECKSSSDCGSSLGLANGKCVVAYRAYCPPRCTYSEYVATSVNSAPISDSTLQLIAADELALVTTQYLTQPLVRTWQPSCSLLLEKGINITNCFTNDQAKAYVASSYVLTNFDFINLDNTVNTQVPAISLAVLFGTVGGNLGMFTGMSMMTVMEWIEFGVFAILCAPFLICRIPMPFIVRKEEGDEGEGDKDVPAAVPAEDDLTTEEMLKILRQIKAVASRRAHGSGGEAPQVGLRTPSPPTPLPSSLSPRLWADGA
mmetsp:Transcript_30496/g.81357  ORF Transcript_30496/g.81357 Transcript_30496/m.81357 type:complete len:775 (+) Transcript_30496:410-2734(+)